MPLGPQLVSQKTLELFLELHASLKNDENLDGDLKTSRIAGAKRFAQAEEDKERERGGEIKKDTREGGSVGGLNDEGMPRKRKREERRKTLSRHLDLYLPHSSAELSRRTPCVRKVGTKTEQGE